MQTQWLNIHNSTEGVSADIYLFDVIDEWFGIGKKSFIEQVNAANANNITLHISSPGGDVDSALAMHDFIKSHPAKVTAKLTGVVASAATFLALAADKVEMSENALFMIHNVWSFARGTADEFRKQADDMDKVEQRIINIYQKKTGMRKAAIQQLVDAETWMDATEAKNYGFVDRVTVPSKAQAKATYESLQSRGFLNIPTDKLQLINKSNRMKVSERIANAISEGFARLQTGNANSNTSDITAQIEAKSAEITNALTTEFQSKIEALQADVTAANEAKTTAETALQNAITEAETLRNEVARLKGGSADENQNADPKEVGENKPESPFKAMAKQLQEFANNKRK
jgi:ATP-dependent Clp endopeptidase proteolytic subunit ClpP